MHVLCASNKQVHTSKTVHTTTHVKAGDVGEYATDEGEYMGEVGDIAACPWGVNAGEVGE